MKREYKTPIVKFVNYAYDVQVVAESSKFDGSGDGHKIDWCTYKSGLFADPCSDIVNSNFSEDICGFQPWSLRNK